MPRTNPSSSFWESYPFPTTPTERMTHPNTDSERMKIQETSGDDSDGEPNWSEDQLMNAPIVATTANPLQAIVMLLQAAHRDVFPMVDGDYKVHPNYLDLPLEQIRAQF
nr:hypothetical protein B0A51_14030 [Rachicladosporium sp. CCFEE 5018]